MRKLLKGINSIFQVIKTNKNRNSRDIVTTSTFVSSKQQMIRLVVHDVHESRGTNTSFLVIYSRMGAWNKIGKVDFINDRWYMNTQQRDTSYRAMIVQSFIKP